MSGEQTIGRTLDVPAGNYIVNATVDALAGNAQIVCAIFSGDGNVGDPHAVLQNGHLGTPDSALGSIAMSGAYSGDATTLWVDCGASQYTTEAAWATQAMIQSVALSAVKLDALQQDVSG